MMCPAGIDLETESPLRDCVIPAPASDPFHSIQML